MCMPCQMRVVMDNVEIDAHDGHDLPSTAYYIFTLYSGDLHNMTRIYTHHIGHGSSLVTIATLLSMKESMFYFSKYNTKPHFFVKNDVIDLALNDPDPDPCRFLFPDPPFTITGRSLVRWI